jgi:phage FluMu protein Com
MNRTARRECVERALLRELRCDCGSLLARLVAGELELKCRRCKRVLTLRVPEGGELEAAPCACEVDSQE